MLDGDGLNKETFAVGFTVVNLDEVVVAPLSRYDSQSIFMCGLQAVTDFHPEGSDRRDHTVVILVVASCVGRIFVVNDGELYVRESNHRLKYISTKNNVCQYLRCSTINMNFISQSL